MNYFKWKLIFVLICFFSISARAERIQQKDGGIILTGKNLQEYYGVYKKSEVKQIRKDLDKFLNGGFNDLKDSPLVKGINKDGTDGLSSFSKDYYKSKFIVIEITPFLGGGVTVSIVFKDKPDKMFDVWVYPFGNGVYETRTFTQDTSFKGEEIRVVYKQLLADQAHCL